MCGTCFTDAAKPWVRGAASRHVAVSLFLFVLQSVGISLSGVMAPGALTAVTVSHGSRAARSGAVVALGHGVVEFPLMVALYYGFGALLEVPAARAAIGAAGGLVLLWMGVGMIRGREQSGDWENPSAQSPLLAGIVLTAANPYFFIWWVTVGATLLMRSVAFGLAGFVLFGVLHWLCDLGWLSFLSALAFKGSQFFGHAFQRGVFLVSGVFLLLMGGRFLYDAASAIWL
ncbi:MAG: hypothetical protein CL611_01205 [Anaerolineaceae bacterium]|nr:hypothetical protein [Anaerolineaceae bacterium]|tara:strand:- start:867 stop:1556 length:690 start_codon:yes stop_codon:yes gene_type:complete